MTPLHLGEFRIETIVETPAVPLPFAQFVPQAVPEALAAHRNWLVPTFASPDLRAGVISLHTYLIRTRHHRILVDTCVGNDKDRGGFPGFHMLRTRWLDDLRAAGVEPESVDFVLCTHMHPDHVGWNTRLQDGRWVPTFPRARYVFARSEYEARRATWQQDATPGAACFADSVLPVEESGQAVLVDSDHRIEDGVALEPAPGHTPGNVVIRLRSREARAVLTGDVIHHPIQVVHPEWSSAFCEDPVASAAFRRRFVAEHADRDDWILPAHFPAPTAGRIVSVRGSDRCRFSFREA